MRAAILGDMRNKISIDPVIAGFCLGLIVLPWATLQVLADERRAPAPKVSDSDGQIKSIFFEKLDDAFQGDRPTLSSIRTSSKAAMVASAAATTSGDVAKTKKSDRWSPLISAASIEDEIKQVRLRYDALITTPGKFNSGGYQNARLDLTILATLFGVIAEYGEEVRWKSDASAARDLIARTAFNCKAGSTQVYNEAKLRKADLQDLVSGTGLAGREGNPESDWSMIADRSPLMEYAEMLIDALEDDGRDEKSIEAGIPDIRRRAELLAMLGEVLVKEGLDDAEDEDYAEFSHGMTTASREVVSAIDRADNEAIRAGISGIRSRCDACHAEYR